MLAILFGATAAPYKITDEKSGEIKSGVSGRLHFARVKPSKKKRDVEHSFGTFTKAIKCDENLAMAARDALQKAGGPIVIDVDTEVSGNGVNAKEEVIDFEPKGLLASYDFTFSNGLKARTRPAGTPT